VQDAAEAIGVRVIVGTDVDEVLLDAGGAPRAVRAGGETIEAHHVVMATGVKPAVAVAAAAGIELGPSGAVPVDDHQRVPGHDGVFAAGDCAESWHRLLEKPVNIQLGTHANKQGRIAGANATGADIAFPGVIGTAVTRLCRYEVARTGISEREAADAGIEVVTAAVKDRTRAGYFPGVGPIWIKVVCEPGTGRLLGGQIVGTEGAAKRIDVLATCVWTGLTVGEIELLDLGYAPPYSGVYDPVLVAARAARKKLA
jgi:NADPH-dependent 2,4-dienoyl-CoA reductase/sulfur reductase-like enzyme